MELSSEIFNKLIHLIDDAKKNKNYEFEVRFWNKNNNLINEENYKKIFQKFSFSKNNNGLGFDYEMKNILDVLLDNRVLLNNTDKSLVAEDSGVIRMTINGEDNEKKYWINSDNNKIEKIFIEKE